MNSHTEVLKLRADARGSLIVFEKGENCPFELKRTYCIFNTREGVERGFHSHKKLQQICVCIAGSCDFVLDDATEKKEVHLDSPQKGLYIGPSVWRYMKNFSADCVLLVMASENYDESDYIRDYKEFLKYAGK